MYPAAAMLSSEALWGLPPVCGMRRPIASLWSLKIWSEIGKKKKVHPSDTSTHSSVKHQTAVGLLAQRSAHLRYYWGFGTRCRQPQARGKRRVVALHSIFQNNEKYQLSYFPKDVNRLLAARQTWLPREENKPGDISGPDTSDRSS